MSNTKLVSDTHIAFSKQYKGVPKHTVDIVNAIKMHKKGLLNTNPIIRKFANADVTYHFSDCNNAYKIGAEQERCLRNSVDELLVSGELTPTEAKALLSVYDFSSDSTLFTDTFPYSLVPSGFIKPDSITGILLNNRYDYKLVLKSVELLDSLKPIEDYCNCLNYGEYVLHTLTNPKRPQEVTGKICLPNELQRLVHSFEREILANNKLATYIKHVLPELTTYGKLNKFDNHVIELTTINRKVHVNTTDTGCYTLSNNGVYLHMYIQ